MDAFNYDNPAEDYSEKYWETEEEKAILRENFRKMSGTFQTVELSLCLIVISWLVFRLPITVRIFSDLLRRLLGLLRSPIVILVLFCVGYLSFMVKSCRASTKNIAVDNEGNYIHENIIDMTQFQEMVELEEVGVAYEIEDMRSAPLSEEIDVEEAVYEDNKIACVVTSTSLPKSEVDDDVETGWCERVGSPRVTWMSSSEREVNLVRRSEEAETFESVDPEEGLSEYWCPTDELNDEQFKETIDAFIQKQRQFRSHEIRYDYYGGRRSEVNSLRLKILRLLRYHEFTMLALLRERDRDRQTDRQNG